MKTPFKTVSVLMLAAASMLVLSACAAPALAQTTTPPAPTDQPHTISVTGSGTAYGAPDIATAQIGITVASLGLGMYGEHVVADWILKALGVSTWAQ